MNILLTSYNFMQPDIVLFCNELNTHKNKDNKAYAKRLEKFFACRNIIDQIQPNYKQDIKILAAYSAIGIHQDRNKTIGHFIINRSEIELAHPALLSRFEKSASKVYLNVEHTTVTADIARTIGIRCDS